MINIQKMRVVFVIGILWLHDYTTMLVGTTVQLDAGVVRDLELVSSLNQTHKGFVNIVDHTFTSCGKVALSQAFTKIQTDISEVKKTQRALQFLVSNNYELDQLTGMLKLFGICEGSIDLLSNTEHDIAIRPIIKKYYFGIESLDALNNSPVALELRQVVKVLGVLSPVAEHLIFHYALQYMFADGHGDHGHGHGHHHEHGHDNHHGHGHHHCATDHFKPSAHASSFKHALYWGLEIGHLLLHLWSIGEIVNDLQAQKAVLNFVYSHIAGLGACFKSMNSAYDIIKKHESLSSLIPDSGALSELFDRTHTDQSLYYLQDALLGDYFNVDEPLDAIAPVGETLYVYRLLQKHMPLVEKACNEFGFIDAVSSMALHVKEHEGKENAYAFAEFIDDAAGPCINAKGMWNVMLGQKSVANDISLGNHDPSKIILTAPNKAGKTGFEKQLALNIILAQTFGVAAAQSFVLTPFHKVLTCMVVTDDISTDQSKFIASLAHAENIVRTQANYKNKGPVFIALDDSLLDGTTSQQRELLSYNLIKELGNFDHTILLVATHLESLTNLELETGGKFCNYRIKIAENTDKKKYSTFFIEKGVSSPDAVFDILNMDDYSSVTN